MSDDGTTLWRQIVLSLRVVAKIIAGFVARLAHILDMGCGKRLSINDFGHNASHEVMVNRPQDGNGTTKGAVVSAFAGYFFAAAPSAASEGLTVSSGSHLPPLTT